MKGVLSNFCQIQRKPSEICCFYSVNIDLSRMGFKAKNIVTDFTDEKDVLILSEIQSFFPFVQAKFFDSGFKGIVGQVNEDKIHFDIEINGLLEKYNVNSLDEAFERIYEFEDKTVAFSKMFPHKKFAYIDVLCFGGTCLYEGFVVKDGEIILKESSSYGGHIVLLQAINPIFRDFYFAPFTRDFFTKKGEISGIIRDFSMGGLWVLLQTDYGDTGKYHFNGSHSSLFLENHDKFFFSFKSDGDRQIKVSGTIYNDSPETIKEIEKVIENLSQAMNCTIQITLTK